MQGYLAAGIWTVAGVALAARGAFKLMNMPGGQMPVMIALAAGLIKGRFIIDRVARQILVRIRGLGGNGPWWGFYSRRNWIMIFSMALLGRFLRMLPLPPVFPEGVILAVGIALIFSSRLLWLAHPEDSPEERQV